MIEYDNILYLTDISEIGGVETFIYEMCKKYQDRDICVVYKSAHPKQLLRLKKFCKCYQLTPKTKIKCKIAIINYDSSIIGYLNEDAKVYQVVHADYTNPVYTKIPGDKRVYKFIGITKHICETYPKVSGYNNIMLGYNPLTIDKTKKTLILVSATRLSKIKGKDRMIKLGNELNKQGINYIWFVFTTDTEAIDNPNIIYMKPRYDIGNWIEICDYLVQLSDTEACSYSINEALYRNKPIIVTPLPYLEEIGYKDGQNGYTLKFDCSNVKEIANKINNIPKFNFKHLEDIYSEILTTKPSKYKEELNMKVKVKCIQNYFDNETNERKVVSLSEPYEKSEEHPNRCEWITTKERAEHLISKGKVTIIEEIKEEIKQESEKAIIEVDNIKKEIIKEDKLEKSINKTQTEKKKRK